MVFRDFLLVIVTNTCTVKLSSRDTPMRGQPVIRGHFLRMVSYLPHVKEPVTKGHLSCRDTFSRMSLEDRFYCSRDIRSP